MAPKISGTCYFWKKNKTLQGMPRLSSEWVFTAKQKCQECAGFRRNRFSQKIIDFQVSSQQMYPQSKDEMMKNDAMVNIWLLECLKPIVLFKTVRN